MVIDELAASLLRLADICLRASWNELKVRHRFFYQFKRELETCQRLFVEAYGTLPKHEATELRHLIKRLRIVDDEEFVQLVGSLRRDLIARFVMLDAREEPEQASPEPEDKQDEVVPQAVVDPNDLIELPRYNERYEGILDLDWEKLEQEASPQRDLQEVESTDDDGLVINLRREPVSDKPYDGGISKAPRRRAYASLLGGLVVVGVLACGAWLILSSGAEDVEERGSNVSGSGSPGLFPATHSPDVLPVAYVPVEFGAEPDLIGASRGEAFVMLAALDALYSNAPAYRDALDQSIRRLTSKDAAWRSEGDARALARSLILETHLTTYSKSAALLPSEVLAEQGAEFDAVGTFLYYVASRLNLDVEGLAVGRSGTQSYWVLHCKDEQVFSEVTDLDALHDVELRQVVGRVVSALVARELESPKLRSDLLDLFKVYIDWVGDREQEAEQRRRYLERLLRLGLSRTREHTRTLGILLAEATPSQVSALDLLAVVEVLGERASEEWWQALLAFRRDHIDRAGISAAEYCADAIVREGGASSRQDELIELLSFARKLTPSREILIDEKISRIADPEKRREYLRRRHAEGDRSEEVMLELAGEALEKHEPERALAFLAALLLGDKQLSQRGPQIAAQALALSFEVGDDKMSEQLLAHVREEWPEDALLWKLEIIYWREQGDLLRAKTLLEGYRAAYPSDVSAEGLLESKND